MFNHANLRLRAPVDRVLRGLVVTPDMHRVHHSAIPVETNSNSGSRSRGGVRLCGTYRIHPEAGHDAMTIGLQEFRDPSVSATRPAPHPAAAGAGRAIRDHRAARGPVMGTPFAARALNGERVRPRSIKPIE